MSTALLLASSSALAGDARHAVLYYLNEGPITESIVRPIVAYVDSTPSQTPIDWMFDAVVVFDGSLYGGNNPTQEAVTKYAQALFDQGQLAALADTVSNLRTELGDPSYRLKLYLTAPYVSGSDAIAQTQLLLDRWDAAAFPELELVGFYWGYEEGLSGSSASETVGRISATGHFVHSLGYELIWFPMFHPDWLDGWLTNCNLQTCALDSINLQVGYAFTTVGKERFLQTDDKVHQYGLTGVLLEFGPVKNGTLSGSDTELQSALTYLASADQYNWSENALTAYYYTNPISGYSTVGSPMRSVYDGLYGHISVNARKSVAPRVIKKPVADTYVEQAADMQSVNHGTAEDLNVGTNLYGSTGNAYRTYLLFDLVPTLSASDVLAAHVRMHVDYYPYGSAVNDGQTFLVSNPTWKENTLTALNEPPSSDFSLIGPHRYTQAQDAPHALDVTDEVRNALTQGSPQISVMLRRATEDKVAAAVSFWSREASQGGGAYAPELEIVYLATVAHDAGIDAPAEAAVEAGHEAGHDAGHEAGHDAAADVHNDAKSDSHVSPDAGSEGGVLPSQDSGASQPAVSEAGAADDGCGCRSAGRRDSSGVMAAWVLAMLSIASIARRRRAALSRSSWRGAVRSSER